MKKASSFEASINNVGGRSQIFDIMFNYKSGIVTARSLINNSEPTSINSYHKLRDRSVNLSLQHSSKRKYSKEQVEQNDKQQYGYEIQATKHQNILKSIVKGQKSWKSSKGSSLQEEIDHQLNLEASKRKIESLNTIIERKKTSNHNSHHNLEANPQFILRPPRIRALVDYYDPKQILTSALQQSSQQQPLNQKHLKIKILKKKRQKGKEEKDKTDKIVLEDEQKKEKVIKIVRKEKKKKLMDINNQTLEEEGNANEVKFNRNINQENIPKKYCLVRHQLPRPSIQCQESQLNTIKEIDIPNSYMLSKISFRDSKSNSQQGTSSMPSVTFMLDEKKLQYPQPSAKQQQEIEGEANTLRFKKRNNSINGGSNYYAVIEKDEAENVRSIYSLTRSSSNTQHFVTPQNQIDSHQDHTFNTLQYSPNLTRKQANQKLPLVNQSLDSFHNNQVNNQHILQKRINIPKYPLNGNKKNRYDQSLDTIKASNYNSNDNLITKSLDTSLPLGFWKSKHPDKRTQSEAFEVPLVNGQNYEELKIRLINMIIKQDSFGKMNMNELVIKSKLKNPHLNAQKLLDMFQQIWIDLNIK